MPKRATKVETDALAKSDFANEDEIMLGMLTAIDRDANTSQRTLSAELGVALGLANAYLKRCARKGWVKIQEVPPRRYAYYLTSQGFAEKTRLAGEYLSSSFTFFRRAREQMSDLLQDCAGKGWKRIAFAGKSEISEIGMICARDTSVELVGVIDPSAQSPTMYYGVPVFSSVEDCLDVDAIIVTALNDPNGLYQAVQSHVGADRTLAPAILRLALSRDQRQGSGQKKQ